MSRTAKHRPAESPRTSPAQPPAQPPATHGHHTTGPTGARHKAIAIDSSTPLPVVHPPANNEPAPIEPNAYPDVDALQLDEHSGPGVIDPAESVTKQGLELVIELDARTIAREATPVEQEAEIRLLSDAEHAPAATTPDSQAEAGPPTEPDPEIAPDDALPAGAIPALPIQQAPTTPAEHDDDASDADDASDMAPLSSVARSGLNAGNRPQAQKPPRVIQDSDEENMYDGSDSDSDSFPGFSSFTKFRGGSGSDAMAAKMMTPSSGSLGDTPPVRKRLASGALESPVSRRLVKMPRFTKTTPKLQGPKLKSKAEAMMDLQALVQKAREDDARTAAARRVYDESAEDAEAAHEADKDDDQTETLATLTDNDALAFKTGRLQRLVGRAQATTVSETWYFFQGQYVPSPSSSSPFPDAAVAGTRWACLCDATTRAELFAAGTVRTALENRRTRGRARLPDALFLWVLDEALREPLPSLRAAYAAVLACCPDQVRRLVDTERLLALFERPGPRPESIDLAAAIEPVPVIRDPYPDRDWAPLQSLLHLLAVLAGGLTAQVVACTVKILLRLGIDSVVGSSADLMLAYQHAVRSLVDTVAAPEWSAFCLDAASSLWQSVQKPAFWWLALASLPADTPACHDLRRRLAGVMYLKDPGTARYNPRVQLAAESMSRLATRQGLGVSDETDFSDLSALVNILDTYIDDAGRDAILFPRDGPVPPASARAFDASVDGLAQRLGALWGRFEATAGDHPARLGVKSSLQRVHTRLTFTSRSREPAKKHDFKLGPLNDVSPHGNILRFFGKMAR